MNIKQCLNKFAQTVCLFAAVLLAGCFESTDEFTLNPDGSGKVVHQCRFEEVDLFGNESKPEDALNGTARKIIQNSKGVEAWRDVSIKREDDGRIYFRGTAYFRRLDDFEIPNQTFLAFSWVRQADGTRVLSQNKKAVNRPDAFLKDKESDASTDSPAELVAKVRGQRAKWRTMKPMLDSTFGKMKHELIFHLPGKISKVSNFQTGADGGVRIKVEGTKFLAAIDKVLNDDELLKKIEGGSPEQLATNRQAIEDDLQAIMFGQKGPVEVQTVPGAKPLFDYAAEVQAAAADFAKLQTELHTGVVAVSAVADGRLKSVEVRGVRLIRITDDKRGPRPFGPFAVTSGCTLSLLAEFSSPVLGVTGESALDAIVADDGTSLLPNSVADRKIGSVTLSSDRTAVVFEVKTQFPNDATRGLKTVSGHLKYSAETGARRVDLGFKRLESGATGSELGAEIKSMSQNIYGTQQIELKLNIPQETFKTAFVVVNGARTPLTKSIIYGSDQSCTLTLTSKWLMPTNSSIEIEFVGEVCNFDAPFVLHDVPLLSGRMEAMK
jgi:hypothetical protein